MVPIKYVPSQRSSEMKQGMRRCVLEDAGIYCSAIAQVTARNEIAVAAKHGVKINLMIVFPLHLPPNPLPCTHIDQA